MIRLLKIDLLKLASYRTFWILNALYILLIISIPVSVIEFLKWLKIKGAEFDKFDPLKIPVLYFPDIWQNITYVYSLLVFFPAIFIIISVSNEFSNKTIKQNIIDGLSRTEFIASKTLTILLLSFVFTVTVFLTGLITGMAYTPDFAVKDVMEGLQFVFAFFLDLVSYFTFTLLLTLFIKRSGLAMAILLVLTPIEYFITARLPTALSFLSEYFPIHARNNLIEFPFSRYWFQEIQDYVSIQAVGVVIVYIVLFIYLANLKLQKSDL